MTGKRISKTTDNSELNIDGGTGLGKGATLWLNGKDAPDSASFNLIAHNGISSYILKGKPDGTLTWGDNAVDTIEEQGDEYIRYSNGIQICWGILSATYSSKAWGSLYECASEMSENYPKSFISPPAVTAGSNGDQYCMVESAHGTTTRTPDFCAVRGSAFTNFSFTISYIAIGKWK